MPVRCRTSPRNRLLPKPVPVGTDDPNEAIYFDYPLETGNGESLTLRLSAAFFDMYDSGVTPLYCVSAELNKGTNEDYSVRLGFQSLCDAPEDTEFTTRYYTYYADKTFKASKTIKLTAGDDGFQTGEIYYTDLDVAANVGFVHFFTYFE